MTAAKYEEARKEAKKNKPLTKEEKEKYNVEERANKISKRHNIPVEDAVEVVTEVVRTKEMPDDNAKPTGKPLSKAAAKRKQKEEDQLNAQHVALEEAAAEPATAKKAQPEDNEPQPVAKGVKGPLGNLLNGQRFFVPGAVGDFILEGWTYVPGAFGPDNQLRKVPIVRQITQRRTATKKEESLKPVTMSGWFEETTCEVIENFALLSGTGTVEQNQEADMANKKAAKKAAKNTKANSKATNGASRTHTTIEDRFAIVEKVLKGHKGPMGIKDFRKALEGKFANRSAVKAELVAAKKIKFNEKDRTISLA